MKWIAPAALLLIAVAAGTTLMFVSVLKPTSPGAFVFFAGWLIAPHAVMGAALVLLRRRRVVTFHWDAVAVMVSAGGVLFLADVIFWHPDAQGAIAVLMTPLLQCGALALLAPGAWWMSRK